MTGCSFTTTLPHILWAASSVINSVGSHSVQDTGPTPVKLEPNLIPVEGHSGVISAAHVWRKTRNVERLSYALPNMVATHVARSIPEVCKPHSSTTYKPQYAWYKLEIAARAARAL